MAILGDIGDPGAKRGGRRREADRPAVEADLSCRGLGDAEEDARDLGAPGADEAGEAEDLARRGQ